VVLPSAPKRFLQRRRLAILLLAGLGGALFVSTLVVSNRHARRRAAAQLIYAQDGSLFLEWSGPKWLLLFASDDIRDDRWIEPANGWPILPNWVRAHLPFDSWLGLGVSASGALLYDLGAVGSALSEFPELEYLDLKSAAVDDYECQYLKGLHNLRYLDLDGGSLSARGLRRLAHMSKLKSIYLARSDIEDEDVAPLLQLRSLRDIRLNQTKTGDRAISQLAALPKLAFIDASSTRMTDAGLFALSKLPELRTVVALNSKVTEPGADKFAEQRPDVTVYIFRRVKRPREQ